ncbi:Homeobox domain containing protein [Trichomonas vaginalis G3]|uniref:Homeobox domain containing protein n=1 Tax=Trichomonas vaginalis (strain ATCC PRA-98 / G3) TaxID=412133 RepID=A2E5Y6_TRIV3|nr:DNA binding [Trichomonas vaginalis G3]EAY11943.1 Homeobox domain containing protein [Trichomonas vaginalis G3]KAI5530392.1 DNA binding [Trichomonas vaginalis G3]|eukprot:XP_001324166.1 Homeobox domain containing protein [Trichomonas vaginalis G3]
MYSSKNSTPDSSSDSYDSDHHGLFPDIYSMMMSRGVIIDKSQMTIFPADFGLPETDINIDISITKKKETKRTLFSDSQRSILMHWLKNHQSNPYPTSSEKQDLMDKTGLNRDQINVWFANNRVRHGMSCSSHHHGKNSHQHSYSYRSTH